jgi:hypothetical protein
MIQSKDRYEAFAEQLNEYLDLGIRDLNRIAQGMNLQRESLVTKLRRYGLSGLLEQVPTKLANVPNSPVRLVLFARSGARAPGWIDHTGAGATDAHGPARRPTGHANQVRSHREEETE